MVPMHHIPPLLTLMLQPLLMLIITFSSLTSGTCLKRPQMARSGK